MTKRNYSPLERDSEKSQINSTVSTVNVTNKPLTGSPNAPQPTHFCSPGIQMWTLKSIRYLKVTPFKRARRLCNSDTRKTEAGETQVRAYRARAGLKMAKQTVMMAGGCPARHLRNSSWLTSTRTLGLPLPGMPRACERRGQVRARPHVTPGRTRRESAS